MLYIYRQAPSDGARALAKALTELGIPAKKFRRQPRNIRPGDCFIMWGDSFPTMQPSLNLGMLRNKLQELTAIRAAGVPCVDFVTEGPAEGWLARAAIHHGGSDLLNPPIRPSYWTKKELIAKEYRLHIFNGQSIRAGRKEKFREDAHDWIRSYQAGWHLVYDGRGVRDKHREIAKAAVQALGLDFGAVDVGERPDGTVFVFEVNRAPGLEGYTITAYAKAIKAWAEEG